mmetsp:Transcript_61067/g.167501  ORF Transcript_61067/g.167501 Transcript_61067/m.167501 type:complete len:112 (+) Transcript_61067:982-1317(+)
MIRSNRSRSVIVRQFHAMQVRVQVNIVVIGAALEDVIESATPLDHHFFIGLACHEPGGDKVVKPSEVVIRIHGGAIIEDFAHLLGDVGHSERRDISVYATIAGKNGKPCHI